MFSNSPFKISHHKARHKYHCYVQGRQKISYLFKNWIFLISHLQIFKDTFYTWHYRRIQSEKWKNLKPEIYLIWGMAGDYNSTLMEATVKQIEAWTSARTADVIQ